MADTAARVDITLPNNATWEDAFKFGTDGDTTWDFVGQSFRLDVKGNRNDTIALMTLSTAAGSIVVDDVVQRVLHFNVPDTDIVAALHVGDYVYDLIMFDASFPSIRVRLMRGDICVTQGITGN